MINDTERREVAKLLRERAGYDMGCVFKELYGDCNSAGPTCGECNERAMRYVADLIDPTCEAHRDVVFYPATGLTPEHEETVFRCGECEEIVSFDESYDPDTDLPAYCTRCGSRITGIGEPWDE